MGSYCINGCLRDEKKCHGCGKTFRPGPYVAGDPDNYYPSTRRIVNHCVICKVAYCLPCKNRMDGGNSPRRSFSPGGGRGGAGGIGK